MELTHVQIIALTSALRQLDGTKDETYKFSSKTRYTLAKNLRILQARSQDINHVRTKMIAAATSGGISLKADTPEGEKFQREWNDFLDSKEEVPGILKFSLSELQLDTNQIPVSALAELGLLIIDEPVDSLPISS